MFRKMSLREKDDGIEAFLSCPNHKLLTHSGTTAFLPESKL